MKELIKYKFVTLQEIAWGDMDAFGHVNNVAYMKYFENARAKYFTHLNLWENYGISISNGMVLTHIEMDYRKQVRFPETLLVTLSIQDMTKRSFQIHCSMWNKKDECVITAKADLLWYDFEKNKVVSLPKSFTDIVNNY